MKWGKKADTKILGFIVGFWLVLSLFLTLYQQSDFPAMDGSGNLNNTLQDIEQTTEDDSSTGLLTVFKFIGNFLNIALNPFNFPSFDNSAITLLTGMILSILRLTTYYIVFRLLRGGG